MLTKYTCGHVGRNAQGKFSVFIRVAEIRGEQVELANKSCPDCK